MFRLTPNNLSLRRKCRRWCIFEQQDYMWVPAHIFAVNRNCIVVSYGPGVNNDLLRLIGIDHYMVLITPLHKAVYSSCECRICLWVSWVLRYHQRTWSRVDRAWADTIICIQSEQKRGADGSLWNPYYYRSPLRAHHWTWPPDPA